MEQEKLARIGELSRKSRSGQTLSAAEAAEQKALRDEYIREIRASLSCQLDNAEILEPDGTRTPVVRRAKAKARGSAS